MKVKFDGWLLLIQEHSQQGSYKLQEIKSYLLTLLPYWVAGALGAVVAVAYSRLFLWCEKLSLSLWQSMGVYFIIIPPLFFVLSWYVVYRFAPYANGSGIPQVMLAAELTQAHSPHPILLELLNLRVAVVKVLSSLMAIIGGGAIGREGPTLQVSASIFQFLSFRIFKLEEVKSRYAFLLAGAAAGLASAFNTPLGGIVYVVEELAKSHMASFRTGVLHSVIFAGLMSQLLIGQYLFFGNTKISSILISQYGILLLIALLSALSAVVFSEALKYAVLWRSKIKQPSQLLFVAMICGLFAGVLMIQWSSYCFGSGRELLLDLLIKQTPIGFRDVSGRFLSTLVTYTAGGAGGIFAPTLSLGGAVGSYFIQHLDPQLSVLATLVGMTAALSALINSPLTSFILILEMTDRHNVLFSLMIAALVGQGVAKFFSKKSFYEVVVESIKERNHLHENSVE